MPGCWKGHAYDEARGTGQGHRPYVVDNARTGSREDESRALGQGETRRLGHESGPGAAFSAFSAFSAVCPVCPAHLCRCRPTRLASETQACPVSLPWSRQHTIRRQTQEAPACPRLPRTAIVRVQNGLARAASGPPPRFRPPRGRSPLESRPQLSASPPPSPMAAFRRFGALSASCVSVWAPCSAVRLPRGGHAQAGEPSRSRRRRGASQRAPGNARGGDERVRRACAAADGCRSATA